MKKERGLSMIRLKVSYTSALELAHFIETIKPYMKGYKLSKNRQGKYLKAYIDLEDLGKEVQ